LAEPTIKHSVLDRLIGADRKWDGTRPKNWNESLDLVKKSLLRDLQWILNTRQISEPIGEHFELLSKSVINFGLPDITALSADSSETPARTLSNPGGSKDRRVQFLIEAELNLDPDPQRIEFDTVLEVSSGKFAVSSHQEAND